MAYYKCGKIFATQNSNTSIETASGAIANFRTSLAMPVLGCNAEFSATQDLHGQSSPYPAGGGKNIAYFEDDNSEQSQHLSVSYSGYNDLSFEVSGTYARIIYGIPCEVGVQYTASFKGYCTADYKRVQFRSSNVWGTSDYGQVTVTGTEASYNLTFTTTSDTIFVAFYLSSQNSTSGKAEIKNFMIEKGDTSTAFAPYENICPIVPVTSVNVTRTGKNLLAKSFEYYTNVGTNLTDYFFVKAGTYRFTFDETEAANWRFVVRMKDANGNDLSGDEFKPRSSGVSWSNNAGGWLNTSNITSKSLTYNFVSDCYIRILFGYGGTSSSTTMSKAQLELGETATTYEPYNGTTALINLGGTYYGGEVDAVTGKITLTHKKYVFDSNLPLSDFGLEALTGYARVSYIPFQNEGKGNTAFLSNTLKYIIPSATKEVYSIWNTTTVPRMFIALPDTITTKQEAIDFFTTHPTEVIAELETPIVVYASNTAEIPTIVGDNQVFADTGDVAVKYRKLYSDN